MRNGRSKRKERWRKLAHACKFASIRRSSASLPTKTRSLLPGAIYSGSLDSPLPRLPAWQKPRGGPGYPALLAPLPLPRQSAMAWQRADRDICPYRLGRFASLSGGHRLGRKNVERTLVYKGKRTVNPARQRSVPGLGRTPGSATARVAAAGLEAGSVRDFPGPEVSPRAPRFNRTDGR